MPSSSTNVRCSSSKRRRRRLSLLQQHLAALFLLLVALVCLLWPTLTGASAPESSSSEQEEETLPLPAPEEDGVSGIPQLKFGEKIRFDELGPIIVNKDGTTRCVCVHGRLGCVAKGGRMEVLLLFRLLPSLLLGSQLPPNHTRQADHQLGENDCVGAGADVGPHCEAESGTHGRVGPPGGGKRRAGRRPCE